MLAVWRQEASQGLAHLPPWSPPLCRWVWRRMIQFGTRHGKFRLLWKGAFLLPPSLSVPFHLRILPKYSLGVFLPLSGPFPILPVLTVVHESEGFRLSSVCRALGEVAGPAYSTPCLSVSSALLLRLPVYPSGFLVSARKENPLALTSFDASPSLSCIPSPSHFLLSPFIFLSPSCMPGFPGWHKREVRPGLCSQGAHKWRM